MKHTNTSNADIVLPDGQLIARGESGDVSASDARHPVVQGWLTAGVLRAERAGSDDGKTGDDKASAKAAAIRAAADRARKSSGEGTL